MKDIIVNEVVGYKATKLTYLFRGLPIVMVYEIEPYGAWENDGDVAFLIISLAPDGLARRDMTVTRSETNMRTTARDKAKHYATLWYEKLFDGNAFHWDVKIKKK